jgi:NADPH:quinone reductase-like Zn-dependent oxidoreductase
VTQMRAMVFDRYGDPDVMSLRDVPVPEPQDGEVLIRVAYADVNPSDTKNRSGESARYRYREVRFPFVVGRDGAGVVERTGSNVNGFRPGDNVIAWSATDGKTWGSYAEFMRVPVKNLSPMPKSLSFAQAAVVPVASLVIISLFVKRDQFIELVVAQGLKNSEVAEAMARRSLL